MYIKVLLSSLKSSCHCPFCGGNRVFVVIPDDWDGKQAFETEHLKRLLCPGCEGIGWVIEHEPQNRCYLVQKCIHTVDDDERLRSLAKINTASEQAKQAGTSVVTIIGKP